jgi:hypothetical protein
MRKRAKSKHTLTFRKGQFTLAASGWGTGAVIAVSVAVAMLAGVWLAAKLSKFI